MNDSIIHPSDAELVNATLRGSREAFGTLVKRHQQFICALAYAKTGSVAASEDIAQDAFIAAWKNLAALRVHENFRGWLCGTTRNLAAKFHRRNPASAPLNEEMLDAGMAEPSQAAMTREEEAMLRATLDQLPDDYREPLVLFYRGGQSVREVSEGLGISEDAVKQRLSRGRAMLREAVREKVESALSHSRPGSVFTLSVLAAIPALTTSVQAAGAGLAVVKGAGAISVTTLLPAMGGLVGLAGAWFGMRSSLRHAESERERRFIARVAVWTMITIVSMIASIMALVFWAGRMQTGHPALWIALMAATVIFFCGVMTFFAVGNVRHQKRIRAEERLKRGEKEAAPDPGFEYRSRLVFLGLPLVHIRIRSAGVAKGWIAAGNVAIAPLAAFGGVAVGGIAFGGVAVGLFSTAAIGIGLVSFSALALGVAAVGGLAIGWIALGGAAWGWLAALGGLSSAKYYAMGHHVSALHAGDATARAFFHDSGLWQAAGMVTTYGAVAQLIIGALFSIGIYRLEKRARRNP